MTGPYRFIGFNRNGNPVMGALSPSQSPALFVKAKYRARWREVSVTDPLGNLVAQVGQTVGGTRTWWAET